MLDHRVRPPSLLTPRQRAVAGLLAHGLTNAEIAEQLVVSRGTVANHVAGILQRLQLVSRTQVAMWAVEHGLRGHRDRLLGTLEGLLELEPTNPSTGSGQAPSTSSGQAPSTGSGRALRRCLEQAAALVADALDADRVEVSVPDPATDALELLASSGTEGDQQPVLRSEISAPLALGRLGHGLLVARSAEADFFAERDALFLQTVSRWVGLVARRALRTDEPGTRSARARLAMKTRILDNRDGERTFVAVFGDGDEARAGLLDLAREQHIRAAHFTAVGGFSRAVLGYFDRAKKQYTRIPIDEQVEVLSFIGDVAIKPDGSPEVHAHVIVGRQDGTTRGGHLLEGHIWPTLEVMLVDTPERLQRVHDAETGLALIDPTAGA